VKQTSSSLFWVSALIGVLSWPSSGRADIAERWLFVPVLSSRSVDAESPGQLTTAFEGAVGDERVVDSNAAAAVRLEAVHSSEPVRVSDAQLARLLQIVGAGRRKLAFAKRAEAEDELEAIKREPGPVRDYFQRNPERAQLLFGACAWTAQLLMNEDHVEQAQQQMMGCVRTFPGYEPRRAGEPRKVFEATRKLFLAAKAQVEQEPHGLLSVEGRPGCVVRVNGLALGKSPAKLRVPRGAARVQLECDADNPGRIHALAMGVGETTLAIDPDFDDAVHTRAAPRNALWLSYSDAAARAAQMDSDAESIASITGATHVVLLVVDDGQVLVRSRRRDVGTLAFATDVGVSARAVREIVGKLLASYPPTARPVEARVEPAERPAMIPARRAGGELEQTSEPNRLLPTIGGILTASAGLAGFGLSWAMYAQRHTIRSRSYSGNASYAVVDEYNSDASWALGAGAFGATALAASGVLLLPGGGDRIPAGAWAVGGAGVVLAGVGVGFAVAGSHCRLQSSEPCRGVAADPLLGPLLVLHAIPLLAVPAIYGFRLWLRPSGMALSVEGSLISLRGTF
jgi:hypothetical protein